MTLEQHTECGPFASHHSLANLPSGEASITLTAFWAIFNSDKQLKCKICDFATFLVNTPTPPTLHFRSHAKSLHPMASLESLLANLSENIFACLQCTRVFPSLISLLLHELFTHKSPTKIYCPICCVFIETTTLLSHISIVHPILPCIVCSLHLPVLDLIHHVLDPVQHTTIPLNNILEFFSEDLHTLLRGSRSIPAVRFVKFTELLPQILNTDQCPKIIQLNNQCGVWSACSQFTSFPKNLGPHFLARISSTEASALTVLVHIYEQGASFIQHQNLLNKYKQHLLQIVLNDFSDNHTLYKNFQMIFPHNSVAPLYPHPSRAPLPIPDTSTLQQLLGGSYQMILIGSHLLRWCGSHLSSEFKILNLSTMRTMYAPTTYLSTEAESQSFLGYISTNFFQPYYVLQHNSFAIHLARILPELKGDKPVLIEMDVIGFLYTLPPQVLPIAIKTNLHEFVLGYFVMILNVLQTLPPNSPAKGCLIIINQAPFKLPQLSIADNLDLLIRINCLAYCVATIVNIPIVNTPAFLESCYPTNEYTERMLQDFENMFKVVTAQFDTFYVKTNL